MSQELVLKLDHQGGEDKMAVGVWLRVDDKIVEKILREPAESLKNIHQTNLVRFGIFSNCEAQGVLCCGRDQEIHPQKRDSDNKERKRLTQGLLVGCLFRPLPASERFLLSHTKFKKSIRQERRIGFWFCETRNKSKSSRREETESVIKRETAKDPL